MEVAQEIERDRAEGLRPGRFRWLGIDAEPEHDSVRFVEPRFVGFVAAHLCRAHGRERERVEREHDVLLAAIVGQADGSATVAAQFEVWGFLARLQCHLYSSPPGSVQGHLSVSIATTLCIRHRPSARTTSPENS